MDEVEEMARIRSVHPGLATDEGFMQLSIEAMAVYPLLLTQADDQGVFEWKPVVLKARLMPSKNLDMEAVLNELASTVAKEEDEETPTETMVTRFTVSGKVYGAIRNFRKWQRPQAPRAIYPLPEEMKRYVYLSDNRATADQDTYDNPPSPGEAHSNRPSGNAPQREEGGGKREEEGESPSLRSGGAGRATRIPDDWEVTSELIGWAREKFPNASEAAIRFEAEQFKAHWQNKPGKGATAIDWSRSFQTWCRNAYKYGDFDKFDRARNGGGQPFNRMSFRRPDPPQRNVTEADDVEQ